MWVVKTDTTPSEKLASEILKAGYAFLRSAGIVKVNGEWVVADDLKMQER